MQAKPIVNPTATVVLLLFAVFVPIGRLFAQDVPKTAPPISVVLFDNPSAYEDNLPKSVVDTRDALRDDLRFEVLLFNPDSPTFMLAAKESTAPISLQDVSSTQEQQSIASAVGAAFYVVISQSAHKHVTAAVMRVGDATTSVATSSEYPKDAASDIAGVIENWKSTETPVQTSAVVTVAPSEATQTSQPSAEVTPAPVITAPPAVSTPTTAPPTPAPVPVIIPTVTQPSAPATAVTPVAPTAPVVPPVLSSGQSATVSSPTLDEGQVIPGTAQVETEETPTVSSASPAISTSPVITPKPSATVSGDGTPTVTAAASPTVTTVEVPVVKAQASIPTVAPQIAPPVASASRPITDLPSVIPAVSPNDVELVTVAPPAAAPQSLVSTASMGETISTDAQNLIDQGDTAMRSSDSMTAVGLYQKAVDLAPRAVAPRLKLAQAYLDAGMKDEATDEARRALAIDPTSSAVQSFIQSQDTGPGGETGDVIVAQAKTESDPNDPDAWISLGDAYWNVGDADDSLISYQHAADIDPSAVTPQTRLAKLYAARAQYDKSLDALQKSGADGYPFALRIIASRSESLVGDLDDETQDFTKGQDTRETFYNKISATNMQAQGLADFVSKITPPKQYKVSHLHRELSTRLLAQATAVWIDYAETNNSTDTDQANILEKHAIDEMKLADVAEDLQSRINP